MDQNYLIIGHSEWKRKIIVALWYLRRRKKMKLVKRKRFWIREIFKNRKAQGDFHNLVAEMRLYDPEKYFNYLRMDNDDFGILAIKVGPIIGKQEHSREPISVHERLALTLRYLASGDSMVSLSYAYRIGKTTVSSIIIETCKAIWSVLKEDVLLKPTKENWLTIAETYFSKWNMPHCIGAVDGKHVVIQAPPNTGSDFYNYKGSFSIVLMALCDAQYLFTLIDVGGKGRQSDGGIFRQSEFGRRLFNNTLNIPLPTAMDDRPDELPYFIVGDEAFPLSKNIMRPYPGRFLSLEKRIFNYRLSRSRRTIENTFGILASKWRIFRKPIIAKLETVESIILATICLHNWLKIGDVNRHENRKYCRTNFVDREDSHGNIIEGEWRHDGQLNNLLPVRHMGGNTYSKDAAGVRTDLTNYFMFEGAIDSQWNK